MRIIKIKSVGVDDIYLKPAEVRGWLDDFPPHEEIVLEVVEMTKKEYEKLPDFRG